MFVIVRKSTLENYRKRIEELEKRTVEQYEMICSYEEKIKQLEETLNEMERKIRSNRVNYVTETVKLNNRVKELEKRLEK